MIRLRSLFAIAMVTIAAVAMPMDSADAHRVALNLVRRLDQDDLEADASAEVRVRQHSGPSGAYWEVQVGRLDIDVDDRTGQVTSLRVEPKVGEPQLATPMSSEALLERVRSNFRRLGWHPGKNGAVESVQESTGKSVVTFHPATGEEADDLRATVTSAEGLIAEVTRLPGKVPSGSIQASQRNTPAMDIMMGVLFAFVLAGVIAFVRMFFAKQPTK